MLKTKFVRLSLLASLVAAVSACGGASEGAPVVQLADGRSSAEGTTAVPEPSASAPSSPPAAREAAPAPVAEIAPAPVAEVLPEPAPATAPVPVQEPTALASVAYALPASGQAVSIGTNVASSIRPAQISDFDWGYTLFQSFGTGSFVPDFSSAGAFVIAASGGHRVTPNLDAAVFDFSDATWKLVSNSNGIPPRSEDYSDSQTTGAPYYEVPGAKAGQVPAAPHLYAIASYVPASHGGGAKGSFLKMGSPAVTAESRQGGGVHKMDLATGLWTRVTNDTLSFAYNYEASTVFDPAQARYYFLVDGFHINNYLPYLDLADMEVKRTATYPYPEQMDTAYQTVFLDPVRRLIVAQRPGHPMRALDLNNIPGGWVVLNTSGTQPSEANRWAFYPPDGRFYTRTNNSGQSLFRLTPPSNWKTGTWTIDKVTITGASMPDFTTTGGTVRHYGTFFYVPALRSLAWISGEDTPVVLLKPPA